MFLPGDTVRDSRRKYIVLSVDDSNPRDIQYAVTPIGKFTGLWRERNVKWVDGEALKFVSNDTQTPSVSG